MSDLTAEKRALRRQIRHAVLPADERRRLSEALCAHVMACDAWRRARRIAAYVPLPEEADITPLLREALRTGRLVLPATLREPQPRMVLREVRSMEELRPDAYGIPAPPSENPEPDPREIGLMLLPLIAADRNGRRLGKGAGCYDRWIALHRYTGCRMGIALPGQVLDRVPAGPLDERLDRLATPDGILICIHTDDERGA
ncbi:MAG: 5-formyltetrahydrofolate cyclo-ligase [Clostridia bacterium]|nr:5-formyltetrahydrofolate cyclo-ligase [Clostridia bacterium]